MLTDYNPVA